MLKKIIAAGLGMALAAGVAHAQSYPAKPVSIVVGYPAGGSTDVIARLIAQKISASLGQSVIVENKAGAAGQIGSAAVAKAKPDGYTILFTNMGPNAIAPSLNKGVTYDPVADFAPISIAATMPLAITVSSSSPIKTIRDLIAAAKAAPGKLTFGSTGIGSVTHVAGELFKSMARINTVHVPYKGGAQVVPATITGEVAYSLLAAPDVMPMVASNRLRLLALSSSERSPLAPDVPTVIEAGIPKFSVDVWYGFLAPAHTPREIIDRLNREIGAALAQPDVKEKLTALSTVPTHSTPEQFQAVIRADVQRWEKVVKDAGITE